jgi:UDP-N-acetyl-2-amino-2-deoxyglucuronate dehydrogenase
MTGTVRVGIIGCGKIAINHAKALAGIDGVELASCCDIDSARADEFATKFGFAKSFDTVERLLDSGVETVTVCTPHPSHEEVVVAAASRGLNVLCEKPIALTLEGADRMTRAAEAAGVKFGVLFQRRFWPASRRARDAVQDGKIGLPIFASTTVRLGRDRGYFDADPWRGKWDAEGGGTLINQAIHYIDLMQWIVGSPVTELSARFATLRHADYIEVEDTAVASIQFANGALGTISAGTTFAPGLGNQVLVSGDNGATITVTEFPEGSAGINDIWTVPGEESYTQIHSVGIDSDPPLSQIHEGLTPYHGLQIADFIDAVIHDREPLVTGREAQQALEVVLAMYESSRTGQPVTLSAPTPAVCI